MKRPFCLMLVLLLGVFACAFAEEAAPAAAGRIVIYVPDENFDQLEAHEVEGEATPEGLVAALVTAGALPEGTAVLAFDGETIDLSEAFGEAVSHTGTAGEYLMLGALVNTLLTNLGLTEISVVSEGQIIETGHNVYDEPLAFYGDNRG